MKIKALLTALSALTVSTVMAMPSINATPENGGAWIQVTKDGLPVPDAIVNGELATDASGRVFVYTPNNRTRSVFNVVTPDGDTAESSIYLPSRTRR